MPLWIENRLNLPLTHAFAVAALSSNCVGPNLVVLPFRSFAALSCRLSNASISINLNSVLIYDGTGLKWKGATTLKWKGAATFSH